MIKRLSASFNKKIFIRFLLIFELALAALLIVGRIASTFKIEPHALGIILFYLANFVLIAPLAIIAGEPLFGGEHGIAYPNSPAGIVLLIVFWACVAAALSIRLKKTDGVDRTVS